MERLGSCAIDVFGQCSCSDCVSRRRDLNVARRTCSFFVPGIPIAKGSGSRVRRKDGTPGPYVDQADMKTKTRRAGGLTRWQRKISIYARDAYKEDELLDEPLGVQFTFTFPRPKRARFDTPAVKPDLGKLARAVEDALTGVVYRDDALIVWESLRKSYGECGVWVSVYPGARATVYPGTK